jgi:hypothetical protein
MDAEAVNGDLNLSFSNGQMRILSLSRWWHGHASPEYSAKPLATLAQQNLEIRCSEKLGSRVFVTAVPQSTLAPLRSIERRSLLSCQKRILGCSDGLSMKYCLCDNPRVKLSWKFARKVVLAGLSFVVLDELFEIHPGLH